MDICYSEILIYQDKKKILKNTSGYITVQYACSIVYTVETAAGRDKMLKTKTNKKNCQNKID